MLFTRGLADAVEHGDVDQLAQQMDKVMQMPDVIAKLKSYDYIPHRTSPQAFAKLIDADNKRWQRIVAETGFKIN